MIHLAFTSWLLIQLTAAQDATLRTSYVSLSNGADAVIYEPASAGAKSGISLIYMHPSGGTFNHPVGRELAIRGYRVLMLNTYGTQEAFEGYVPAIAASIRYLRSLPGVTKVVFVTHSGGGPVMTFYENVAENGPKACQDPAKISPCRGNLSDLPKADGLILLDSVPGAAFHWMTAVDPAVGSTHQPRNPELDMFDPKNSYDRASGSGGYSSDFVRKFFQAQSARNMSVVQRALARLDKLEKGESDYRDDEPFIVPGVGVASAGARLYQTDLRLLSRTRQPHVLLKADESKPTQIIPSVRPPLGTKPDLLSTLRAMTQSTTVRKFLADSALRTTSEFSMTADNIIGVDWASSSTSVPSNIEGVKVPTLVMAMNCHYFVVPSEIAYDHAGATDKQYVAVEGATHMFRPCKPEYGDTQKRLFDYVDGWLSARGRFAPE
jgi:pimeloyl-ACP methyl ester carboxylesterase